MPIQPRILIIETAARDAHGSMGGYAEVLVRALQSADASIDAARLDLSVPARGLRALPPRLRQRAAILFLLRNAMRELPSVRAARLVHLVDGSQAHLLRWLSPSVRRVVTAHDLIPLLQLHGRFPAFRPGPAARWLIAGSIRQLRRADRVIAVSENTKCDLEQYAGVRRERIRVVANPVRHDYSAVAGNCELNARTGTSDGVPVVLHLGNNAFYKNRTGVARIFSRIAQESAARLVLAGPSPDASLRRIVSDLGLAERVEFRVDPDQQELVALYRSASLLLFPSIYEGFGWPPLEAMAVGCPVVCSNVASLPEVVGDAALTGDPADEELLARDCLEVLTNPTLAAELRERGFARAALFTPERMGRELLEIYRELWAESPEGR